MAGGAGGLWLSPAVACPYPPPAADRFCLYYSIPARPVGGKRQPAAKTLRRAQVVDKVRGAGASCPCRVWAEPTYFAPQRFSASTASTEGARCAALIEKYGFSAVRARRKNPCGGLSVFGGWAAGFTLAGHPLPGRQRAPARQPVPCLSWGRWQTDRGAGAGSHPATAPAAIC